MRLAPDHNHRMRPFHGQAVTEIQQRLFDDLVAQHGDRAEIRVCQDCDYLEMVGAPTPMALLGGRDKMLAPTSGRLK